MKLYRVLALALAIVMMGCILVACDQKEPEQTEKTIVVRFTVKDGPDKDSNILIQDPEYAYNYKGDADPTITEVLIDICEFEEVAIEFKDESQETITKIGNKSAGDGKFWTYALNYVNDLDNPMYVQTVKEGDIIVVYLDSIN